MQTMAVLDLLRHAGQKALVCLGCARIILSNQYRSQVVRCCMQERITC